MYKVKCMGQRETGSGRDIRNKSDTLCLHLKGKGEVPY